MIGNELEIEIIELFRKDITRLLSINQISKHLNKAYPYIHKKVSSLISDGVLNKIIVGKATLCSINLESEEAVILLSINELIAKKKLLEKNKKLSQTLERMRKENKEVPIHIALSSRDELLIVAENHFYKKTLKKEFKEASILTKKEFQESILKNDSVLRNHTILYHNERYYEIISEIEGEIKVRYGLR